MASTELASSSLKDLLKICRSHSILLPPELPKDKQYYIDLIVRHRQAAKEIVEVYEGEEEWERQQREQMQALQGLMRQQQQQQQRQPDSVSLRREGSGEDFVQVSHEEALPAAASAAAPIYPQVTLRARGSSRSAASAAASSSVSSASFFVAAAEGEEEGKEACEASFASAFASSSASSSSAAASYASIVAAADSGSSGSGLSASEAALAAQDVVYAEEDEEDAAFIRSPAVQKITGVLQNIAVFDFLERHTAIPRFYWLVLLLLLLSLTIFLWIGPLAVCNFICFIYPAYKTYQTLEGKFVLGGSEATSTPGGPEQPPLDLEEDQSIEVHRYWLSYWCVYGLFKLFEFGADLLCMYWIPSYWNPLKVLFLVWCFHPASQGCSLVYRWIIRPLFLPREDAIDRSIDNFNASVNQAFVEVKGIILKKVAKRIAGTDETPVKPDNKERR